jgi:hypothetical protein
MPVRSKKVDLKMPLNIGQQLLGSTHRRKINTNSRLTLNIK